METLVFKSLYIRSVKEIPKSLKRFKENTFHTRLMRKRSKREKSQSKRDFKGVITTKKRLLAQKRWCKNVMDDIEEKLRECNQQIYSLRGDLIRLGEKDSDITGMESDLTGSE
jgi:hypothetical protein